MRPPGTGLPSLPRAPVDFISAFSLPPSVIPFFPRGCGLLSLSSSFCLSLPIAGSLWFWTRPSPSPLSFFLEAAAEWRGGGKCSPSPICSFLGGNTWRLMAGRGLHLEDRRNQRPKKNERLRDPKGGPSLEGNGGKGQIEQRTVFGWEKDCRRGGDVSLPQATFQGLGTKRRDSWHVWTVGGGLPESAAVSSTPIKPASHSLTS